MRNAGLNGVDRRVANRRVAEQQLFGQIAAEPAGLAIGRNLGQASRRAELAIAFDALEPAAMEKNRAVKILPRIERQQRRPYRHWRERRAMRRHVSRRIDRSRANRHIARKWSA